MKKQKKQLIIAVVILIVLIGGYFGLKKYNEIEASKVVDDSVSILSLDAAQIKEISLTSENGTLDIVRENDTWSFKDDASTEVKQGYADTLATSISSVGSYYTIKDATDLEQYGLGSDASVAVITMNDGTTHTIKTGVMSEINYKYYAMIDSDPTVYMISSDLVSYLKYTKDNLVG